MQPRARVDTVTLLIVTVVLAALVALGLAGYLLRLEQSSSTTTTTVAPGQRHAAAPAIRHGASATQLADVLGTRTWSARGGLVAGVAGA
jgi:hypothetical protein